MVVLFCRSRRWGPYEYGAGFRTEGSTWDSVDVAVAMAKVHLIAGAVAAQKRLHESNGWRETTHLTLTHKKRVLYYLLIIANPQSTIDHYDAA